MSQFAVSLSCRGSSTRLASFSNINDARSFVTDCLVDNGFSNEEINSGWYDVPVPGTSIGNGRWSGMGISYRITQVG